MHTHTNEVHSQNTLFSTKEVQPMRHLAEKRQWEQNMLE